MEQKIKEEFKKSIEEQIAQLSKEIAAIKKAVYPRDSGISDKVAHISFKQEQSINFQRLEEAQKRLNRLKYAFTQVDTPNFGICKECGVEIAIERLKMMPESIYCVECMNELGL